MAVFDTVYIYGRMVLRYPLVVAPYLFKDLEVEEPYCKLFHPPRYWQGFVSMDLNSDGVRPFSGFNLAIESSNDLHHRCVERR